MINMSKHKWILSAASVIAGIVNGFIGTGGGIILYFALKLSSKDKSHDEMKDILATIIAAIIPVSIVSAVVYMIRGEIIYTALPVYLPAALTGGIIGALLLQRLHFKIIKKIFAALIIYAGVRMVL